MNKTEHRRFARIMALPDPYRIDMLEFVGSGSLTAAQIDALLDQMDDIQEADAVAHVTASTATSAEHAQKAL